MHACMGVAFSSLVHGVPFVTKMNNLSQSRSELLYAWMKSGLAKRITLLQVIQGA